MYTFVHFCHVTKSVILFFSLLAEEAGRAFVFSKSDDIRKTALDVSKYGSDALSSFLDMMFTIIRRHCTKKK